MNIATALNKKYLQYTGVMLASLCKNHPDHVDAFLLNSELDDADIEFLRAALSKFDIALTDIKVTEDRFDENLPHTEEWPMEVYFRLLLPELLPTKVQRVLYLDVDIIINQNIAELYNRDMEGMDLWAADDTNGTTTKDRMQSKQSAMFEPLMARGYRYFNSGVMLLNIEQIRAKYGIEAYARAIEEWDRSMDAPDQDILNWVHRDAVGYFPWKKYNLFASHADQLGYTYEDVIRETAIVHYAGVKPWNTRHLHYEIEQLWWDYAKEMPFYLELLEAFQKSVMWDKIVEEQMNEMANDYERLIETSLQLAERIKMLESGK